MTGTVVDTSIPGIRGWLSERVAFYLECPVEDVRPDVRLVEIGLDSVYAMTLSGDAEDYYDVVVEPTMAWDHPTVDALARYLHGVLDGGG